MTHWISFYCDESHIVRRNAKSVCIRVPSWAYEHEGHYDTFWLPKHFTEDGIAFRVFVPDDYIVTIYRARYDDFGERLKESETHEGTFASLYRLMTRNGHTMSETDPRRFVAEELQPEHVEVPDELIDTLRHTDSRDR